MTGTEIMRLTIVLVAGTNIGLTIALFERVGQHVVPTAAMRTLMAGFALVNLAMLLGSVIRFHVPPTWVAYIVLPGMLLELAGLVIVFHWYGTEAGIRHSATMRASVARER